MSRTLLLVGLLVLACDGPGTALACFGTHLRVGVAPSPAHALAAYTLGYYVEEKTGIEPEFVELASGLADALLAGKVDVVVAVGQTPPPEGLVVREAGAVPGAGPSRFWIRPDVLEDLRFYTVDRALGGLPAFYRSEAYRRAAESEGALKKAARRAVLDAG